MKTFNKKLKANLFIRVLWGLLVIITMASCGSDGPMPDVEDMSAQMDNQNNNSMGNDGNTSSNAAPNFTLQTLEGGNVSLSNYKDKVVVIFFFGNACPSCRAVAPKIQSDLNVAYKNQSDYAIIGIDQWDGNSDSVNSFKSATGVSFPLLLKGSSVARNYSTTFDRLVVIDKKGNVAFKGSRSAANDITTVKSKIQELL